MRGWRRTQAHSAVLAALGCALAANPAHGVGSFAQAIVIGANRSVDSELPPLRYADDDAARFAELFEEMGIESHLLTRPDENTRRLHAGVLSRARLPTRAQLALAVAEAKARTAHARLRGDKTLLYVVFAGHGNAEGDRGYVTLEDSRLFAREFLKDIVDQVAANEAHVVIDACRSYLFASSRGAGGTHQPVRGFLAGALGPGMGNTGFLLSSNSSGETHEWEAFQSGVFSHEVRSGLTGAADVDGDGVVSYQEIAAFVDRANANIVNSHYRPEVYARPPRGQTTLMSLAARRRQLRVDGLATGKHYLVEDSRGVRWADFHAGRGQPLRILLPAGNLPLYVRGVADGQESVLETAAREIVLADQATRSAEAQTRGAAHRAFTRLFSLPFDRQTAMDFGLMQAELATPLELSAVTPTGSEAGWRRGLGIAALATAGAAAAVGGYLIYDNRRLLSATPADVDQRTGDQRNQTIDLNDRRARWLFGGGAAVALGGLALLLWPSQSAPLEVSLTDGGATVQLSFRR